MERSASPFLSVSPFPYSHVNLTNENEYLTQLKEAILNLIPSKNDAKSKMIYSDKIRVLAKCLHFTQRDIRLSDSTTNDDKLNSAHLKMLIEVNHDYKGILENIQFVQSAIQQKLRVEQQDCACTSLQATFRRQLLRKSNIEILSQLIVSLKDLDGIGGEYGFDREILMDVVHCVPSQDIAYRQEVLEMCIKEGLNPQHGQRRIGTEEKKIDGLFFVLLDNYVEKRWDDKEHQGFDLIRALGSWQPHLLNEKYYRAILKGYETPLHKVATLGSVVLFYLFFSLNADVFSKNGMSNTAVEVLIQTLEKSEFFVSCEDIYTVFRLFRKFRDVSDIHVQYKTDNRLIIPIAILIDKLIQKRTAIGELRKVIQNIKDLNLLAPPLDIGHEILIAIVRNIKGKDIRYRIEILKCCIAAGLTPRYEKLPGMRLGSGSTLLHTLLSNYKDWDSWSATTAHNVQGEGITLLGLVIGTYPQLLNQRYIDCNKFIDNTPLHEVAQCKKPLPLYAVLMHYLLKQNSYDTNLEKKDFLGNTPLEILMKNIGKEYQWNLQTIERKLEDYLSTIEDSTLYGSSTESPVWKRI